MTIQWLTREDIGLQQPNRWNGLRDRTTDLVFHHSGTSQPSMPTTVEQSIIQWRSIQFDHLARLVLDENGRPRFDDNGQPLRWADIAYNIGIGYRCVLDGRGLGVIGGGTGKGWDLFSPSICILGNMTLEDITPDLEETVLFALKKVRQLYGNDLGIYGDRQINQTNCPGDNVFANKQRWWDLSAKVDPTPSPSNDDTEEDDDMGKPLYRIRSEDEYEAWLVRWDNGKLTHLGPAENASPVYNNLPTYVEADRETYKRLVEESGTPWRPTK